MSSLYKPINTIKSKLNIDEDAYRAMIYRINNGSGTSLKDCTHAQLLDIMNEMKQKAFGTESANKPIKKVQYSKRHISPVHNKALSLWIQLRQAGALRDPSDQAFASYCRKRTKLDHWHWMTPSQSDFIIEGLKTWLAREVLKRLRAGLEAQGTIYSDDDVLWLSGATERNITSMGRMTSAMSNNAIRILSQRHEITNVVHFINGG